MKYALGFIFCLSLLTNLTMITTLKRYKFEVRGAGNWNYGQNYGYACFYSYNAPEWSSKPDTSWYETVKGWTGGSFEQLHIDYMIWLDSTQELSVTHQNINYFP